MIIDMPASLHIHGLRRLWQEAFGDAEEVVDSFFATAFSPERCRCVFRWETVAGALYWLDCAWEGRKIAYIYAVATAQEFRGRGLCKLLMEDVHAHLKGLGYDLAALVPSDEGLRQMYGKLGYRDFGGMDSFSCSAGSACALRELTAEEYGALRRQYLPENAVVQEGATLTYLARHARFYAGEDFLLCCAMEDGKLQGIELLGNREKAPAMVAALGAREGTFRVPGSAPFAMGLSLRENAPLPGYFGLALD